MRFLSFRFWIMHSAIYMFVRLYFSHLQIVKKNLDQQILLSIFYVELIINSNLFGDSISKWTIY